jgi:transcription antitermination factor NusG
MSLEGDKLLGLQNAALPLPSAMLSAASVPQWYAVHTRAKHERRVAAELPDRGIEAFVPLTREIHRWSDRNRVLDVPLFPCYAFVSALITPSVQATVLQHPSVLRWVGFQGRPSPISESEILSVQALVNSGVPIGAHPFVKFGERVRIRGGGSLHGVEGILVGNQADRKLIVSVEILGQSVAISLENYEVEAVAEVSAI